jgi:hypothetical protein
VKDNKTHLWEVGRYQENNSALDSDRELVMLAAEPVVEGETGQPTHKQRARVDEMSNEVE